MVMTMRPKQEHRELHSWLVGTEIQWSLTCLM
eukprot:COSAG02_NODE_60750_length_270_cov_0.900585_1_plen_31_part_10